MKKKTGRPKQYACKMASVYAKVPAEAKPLVMAYINKIREEWKQKL